MNHEIEFFKEIELQRIANCKSQITSYQTREIDRSVDYCSFQNSDDEKKPTIIIVPQIIMYHTLANNVSTVVVFASFLFLLPSCCHTICEAFAFVGVGIGFDSTSKTITTGTGLMMTMTTTTTMMIVTDNNNNPRRRRRRQQRRIASSSLLNMAANVYDDFRSDAVVDTMYLDEENVIDCLDEFIDSDYGTTMFGCHDRAASIGITGYIEFVELCGPTVTLRIPNDDDCKFWHTRSFVLGRAAVYLNARIPEITNVIVNDLEELNDFQEIKDEFGELLYKKDKRSKDFNGDRYTMEYQGMDPDMRGPFPINPLSGGGTMLSPS